MMQYDDYKTIIKDRVLLTYSEKNSQLKASDSKLVRRVFDNNTLSLYIRI